MANIKEVASHPHVGIGAADVRLTDLRNMDVSRTEHHNLKPGNPTTEKNRQDEQDLQDGQDGD